MNHYPPPVPEATARHFGSIIERTASRVYHNRVHGKARWIDYDDVLSAARAIAYERHQDWTAPGIRNPQGYARTDLGQKLDHWVDSEFRRNGWTRPRGRDGKQAWKPPSPRDLHDVQEWWRDKSRDELVRLMPSWEPMSYDDTILYAETLFARYPHVAAAFEPIGRDKPEKASWERWQAHVSKERERLWAIYGRELNQARYYLKYGEWAA